LKELLLSRPEGLYCPEGDFYIDPSRPVKNAVITHAHGDHASSGSKNYFCIEQGEALLKKRLVPQSKVTAFKKGDTFRLGKVALSFHPAGHILGSSQVRMETPSTTWVMSGDYKRDPDPTCDAFEPVECDVFITEATFGLPVYRWEPTREVARQIFEWWEKNAAEKKTSILYCYALGKAQRVLAELMAYTERPVLTHGAVEGIVEVYRREGVKLLPTIKVSETDPKADYAGELVLAPPSAYGSAWLRRFKNVDTAFASGWMRIRGNRRRKGYDRGFVLSDHADWPSLLQTIEQTKAKHVYVTHGSVDILVPYLKEKGISASGLATDFQVEDDSE